MDARKAVRRADARKAVGVVRWADKRADKNFCPVVCRIIYTPFAHQLYPKNTSDTCIQCLQGVLYRSLRKECSVSAAALSDNCSVQLLSTSAARVRYVIDGRGLTLILLVLPGTTVNGPTTSSTGMGCTSTRMGGSMTGNGRTVRATDRGCSRTGPAALTTRGSGGRANRTGRGWSFIWMVRRPREAGLFTCFSRSRSHSVPI